MKQHAAKTEGNQKACGRNRGRVYAMPYDVVIEMVRKGEIEESDLCRHCCGPVFAAIAEDARIEEEAILSERYAEAYNDARVFGYGHGDALTHAEESVR